MSDDGLNELDVGDWMGMRFDELHHRREWLEYNQHRSTNSPPGGESLLAVQARAWQSVSKIVARRPGEQVAVVTHADVIRALLMLLLGVSLDHLLRMEIAPASVSDISIDSGEILVHGFNALLFE